MASYPNQSWMANCSARTKLTPFQWCFPGTHDTGAYQRPDFTIIASNEAIANSVERFAPGFQEVASRWAMSQPGASVYDQLMNGVRYLDLRVSSAKDPKTGKLTYYLIHTFVVCHMDVVLDDISRFLAGHPTEVLLIEAAFYHDTNALDFQDYAFSKIGKYLYPDTHNGAIPDTIDQITKKGKQLIFCLDCAAAARGSLYYFSGGSVLYSFPFFSIDNVAAKQAYLLQQLQRYIQLKDKRVFQLTYTLTEVSMDVVASIFTEGSLKKYADKMNPTQKGFIMALSKEERAAINTLENDDQMNSQNVEIAQMLLAERITSLEPVSRPLAVCAAPGQAQAGPLPAKQGACGLVGQATEESAWALAAGSRKTPSVKDHSTAERRRQRRQRPGCLRYLCCCMCCGNKSESEDEEPLVKRQL